MPWRQAAAAVNAASQQCVLYRERGKPHYVTIISSQGYSCHVSIVSSWVRNCNLGLNCKHGKEDGVAPSAVDQISHSRYSIKIFRLSTNQNTCLTQNCMFVSKRCWLRMMIDSRPENKALKVQSNLRYVVIPVVEGSS